MGDLNDQNKIAGPAARSSKILESIAFILCCEHSIFKFSFESILILPILRYITTIN